MSKYQNEYQIQARMRVGKEKFKSDSYYLEIDHAAKVAIIEAKRSADIDEIQRKFREAKSRIEEASAEFERVKREEFKVQVEEMVARLTLGK
jgi:predicted transcriptional regulator